MKYQNSSSHQRIDTAAKAKVFQNAFGRRLLLTCIPKAQSIKMLSIHLGVDLAKVHYYMRRLLKLGLVRVESTQARAGRGINMYRATADGFFVPIDLVATFDAALRDEMFEAIDNQYLLSGGGTVFTVSASGAPLRQKIYGSDDRPKKANELWVTLNISQENLEQLNQEIIGVIGKYKASNISPPSKSSRPIETRTMLHFAYVPIDFKK